MVSLGSVFFLLVRNAQWWGRRGVSRGQRSGHFLLEHACYRSPVCPYALKECQTHYIISGLCYNNSTVQKNESEGCMLNKSKFGTQIFPASHYYQYSYFRPCLYYYLLILLLASPLYMQRLPLLLVQWKSAIIVFITLATIMRNTSHGVCNFFLTFIMYIIAA